MTIYIEEEGVLYRGPDLLHPLEVWNYAAKQWVEFHGGPQCEGWATEVDEARAEVLKIASPGAAHYMYYDTPPWSQPTSQAYWESLRPDDVKRRIAERERARSSMRQGPEDAPMPKSDD